MVQSSSCRGPVKTATPRKTSIRKRTHIFLMNFANVWFCLSSLRGDISTIRLASCFFSFNTFGINVCLGQLPLFSVSPEFVFSVLRVWNLLKDQLTYKTHFELSATGSML